jgi:hypothetical protein
VPNILKKTFARIIPFVGTIEHFIPGKTDPEVYRLLCRTSAVKLVKSISNSFVESRSCCASCMQLISAESFSCLLQLVLAFTVLLDR